MKKPRLFIRTLLIATGLFIMGQYKFTSIFEFLEPKFDRIILGVLEIQRGVPTSLLFSTTLFLIPIFTVLAWRLAGITTNRKKTATALIILAFIAAALCMRRIEVKSYYTYLLKNDLIYFKDNQPVNASVDPINFVYYMFAGLCLGSIFSFLTLRQKNKRMNK